MATKTTKRKQIELTQEKAILDTVKNIKAQDVVSQVNTLQISIQQTLAQLSSAVTNKVQQIDDLDNAILIKKSSLQELCNMEKEAFSMDELRAEHALEDQAWHAEVDRRNKELEQRSKELEVTRKRQQDEWNYEFEQRKKKLADEFATEVERNKRNEAIRKETQEKAWAEREAALKMREAEINTLKENAVKSEAAKAEEIKTAESRIAAGISSKYNHEIALLKKDAEAEKRVADMKNASLLTQIDNLNATVESLQTQLVSARQDAKEVAQKALEGAASRQLAETLQKVVTEGQTSNGKSK